MQPMILKTAIESADYTDTESKCSFEICMVISCLMCGWRVFSLKI